MSTGVVHVAHEHLQTRPCKDCEGFGKVIRPAKCGKCNNTGFIYETFEVDVTPKQK